MAAAKIAMVTGSFDDVGSVDGRFHRLWQLPATVIITTVMVTGGFDVC